jgi:mono/diheme cytochrome c family protein
MDETLFYIAGGVLVVVALLLAFIGLRSDRFPSDRVLIPGIVVVALLVAATAVGAVELAQHEQENRLGEANTEAAVKEAAQNEAGQQAGAGTEVTPADKSGGGGGGGGGGIDGSEVFVSTGCGSCHTLKALGSDAQGTIGPDLDQALAGKDAQFIEQSIVDPSAYVEKGYPDGTMPSNYKEQLSPDQIKALVAFLVKSTSGGGSGSSG